MSRYVLIHGAWHGSWCWDKVVPLLKQSGHQVETPDLPGNQDTTPRQEVSLEAYTQHVCEALDAHPEPVILVGHSLGGLVISQAAERRPEHICSLVYLAAALLSNGETLLGSIAKYPSSSLLPHLIVDQEQMTTTIKREALRTIFYHDCNEEDILRAESLLVPQSMAIYGSPLELTPGRFGKIPRMYITCLRDKVIHPSLQKEMYTAVPCQKVLSLDTGHFPFFSAPEKLVQLLTSLHVTTPSA